MTEESAEPEAKPLRSHAGCKRCKRRRQRCDEKKPQCGRCSTAKVICEYAVNLRWGGRDFGRSRFGQCMKGNISKLADNAADGFVYTSSLQSEQSANEKQEMVHGLPGAVQYLAYLSIAERCLLHHFRDEASRITSCHSHVQTELCQLILPMALESPALMHATLAWAAIHSVGRRSSISHVSDPDICIARLKAKSIENLRVELQDPNPERMYALLATVRTLTQCEIHSGSDGASAWRVHIEGAKALMTAVRQAQRFRRRESGDGGIQPRLLYRWYDSLDSLAALTSAGHYTQPKDAGSCASDDDDQAEDAYLDDYNGYYTDLSILLGKIGSASRAWRSQKKIAEDATPIRALADDFEEQVYEMMDRDQEKQPTFYPGVVEKLSPQAILEYSLCNQTYQQIALIHINRRLRDLPAKTPMIQDSVKKIIDLVRSIAPATGSSPLVVMATPLFTAGCEAFAEDRDAVRELLAQLYSSLKIRNIKLSLQVLEAYWARKDHAADWEDVLRQKNWNFIPY